MSDTVATEDIQISPTTPAGGRIVSVITDQEAVSGPLFSVTPGIATISISTSSVAQFSIDVPFTVTGNQTHFLQGDTTLNFGSGITISQFQVLSPTQITGQMAVASTAPIGFRGITATTDGEVATSNSDALLVTLAVPTSINITPASGAGHAL